MAFSLLPAGAPTTITEFPHNPKTLILQQCKTIRDLHQIHGHLIKTRFILHYPSISDNLIESAAILLPEKSIDYALAVFSDVKEPCASSFNIMIRGFTLNQSPNEAIMLFKQMCDSSVKPDDFTFTCVLKACSRIGAIKEGRQIHAQMIKHGLISYGFVENTLIHMYGSCGDVDIARKVFDAMPMKDVYCWNAMFAGYIKNSRWKEVVNLFRDMMELNVEFNEVTLICVLPACGRLADIELGEWIHKHGVSKMNINLITALIDMYAKCGYLDKAKELFDEMPVKDVVAWSAMISGFNQVNRCKDALQLFDEMQKANVEPNEVTMVSVLTSCSVLGALKTGEWIHSYMNRKKLKITVNLGTALIDFYSKCGCIDNAILVFDQMPTKNVWSWTSLIQGLASNGKGKTAIESFHAMVKNNIDPNEVTFIAVLSACSHSGLVQEGRKLFESMSRDFNVEPKIEHYGCMVDILGRFGSITEAYQFILNMPIKPNAIIWRTLLASCKLHKNIDIAEESLKNLVRLEPMNSGDYILLSNVYSSVGDHTKALNIRSEMKGKGIKKPPGGSLIELDGVVHEIFAEESIHPDSKHIYGAVNDMIKNIKLAGYKPNINDARIDADEDYDKETSVSHHSEKLAIAYGLLKTQPGTLIRISKNLRVCKDCHNAVKIISNVYDREFVIRDSNRFHHFKNGICSCKDYW
ncbi:pentatricopeptide repeat-containing protein At1g08070, chloroplastic-like [Impatiens glandulifera]|uniref:pentatricopeptide repeat-containing protein At1g08070, chloroplastic-like n=1 Tax=Impatiens glandulifera TaxID=253017 RepID=UPI001FB085E5|nr:pentatricopeptide repeat-containing protein At1g08070, chloroplastic-like [Impatiens glandulifera]